MGDKRETAAPAGQAEAGAARRSSRIPGEEGHEARGVYRDINLPDVRGYQLVRAIRHYLRLIAPLRLPRPDA